MARVFLLLSTPPLFWQEGTEGTSLRRVEMLMWLKREDTRTEGSRVRPLLIHLYPPPPAFAAFPQWADWSTFTPTVALKLLFFLACPWVSLLSFAARSLLSPTIHIHSQPLPAWTQRTSGARSACVTGVSSVRPHHHPSLLPPQNAQVSLDPTVPCSLPPPLPIS